ncbi:MAG: alanyl-tRNA editing protein, partial [Lachnospiraceae bacterium]|nr:alanyl-tRNA editing protein [Lachnospiraceae bacterium]
MTTEKLFYDDAYLQEFDAEVLSCNSGEKGSFLIILDRTAFYPEGGGQPGDRGRIGDAQVLDTIEKNGEILHVCSSAISPGTKVRCGIDWARRLDHMQQHTGEHIISGMICSELHCDNVGFHMGEDTVTIDYSAYADMDRILEIEAKANRYILEDHPAEIF